MGECTNAVHGQLPRSKTMVCTATKKEKSLEIVETKQITKIYISANYIDKPNFGRP